MKTASQIVQQMIDFQKISFLSCYDAATAMQNQATSTLDLMLTQAAWVPSEGRRAVSAWMNASQQERDRLKAFIEKSYTCLGMFFIDKPATAPAKPKKPARPKEKKAVTARPKKAAPVEGTKATPDEVKKAASAEVKKVAPIETKKTVPVEPQATKSAAVKKTVPPKNAVKRS
jgi:hypothetical protein